MNSPNEKFAIERLLQNNSFPHDVSGLRLIETHISWVVLTGPFAYKIKKPVRFDFVDYSTLTSRKRFCDLELKLNRRFAAELYIDVVPINIVDGELRIGASGIECGGADQPVEYAVKMKQFSQSEIVAARLDHCELTSEVVDQFGTSLANFHDSIEIADRPDDFDPYQQARDEALGNFRTLADAFPNDDRSEKLNRLQQWTIAQLKKLQSTFQKRIDDGKIRRCHGDLHLKNILQLDGQLVPFDGIEFNEDFQWIDVLSELAFPVMDFMARGRPDLGWQLLNTYFEITDDYQYLDLLKFYLVYRALVRAKVSWLNPKNHNVANKSADSETEIDSFAGPWDKYLAVAIQIAFGMTPTLSITHGFSGSGKSTVAMKIVQCEGGIRVRSDVERHRLAKEANRESKYSPDMSQRIYDHIHKLARSVIEAGFSVICDATFLQYDQRQTFEYLARELAVDYQIIDCNAPFEELCRRIRGRYGDASEATIDVLKMQIETHDPLTKAECALVRRWP